MQKHDEKQEKSGVMNKKTLRNLTIKNEFISVVLCLLLVVVLTFESGVFWTRSNLDSLQASIAPTAIMAFGMMVLLICGYFDLSIGSVMLLAGILSGRLALLGAPIPVTVLLVLLAGLAVGCLNGFLVSILKINALIATIGTQYAVFGLRWTILLMGALALVFEVLLAKSRHLKQLYYIGHNADTAVLYGLGAGTVKCLCFALSAAMSAFGGALMTARLAHPNVTVGSNLEISVITAAVISGASIFGGRGSMIRTMLGVLFVFMLQNGMTSYNVNTYVQQIILGAMLILAIYLDIRVNAKKT
jgi:ribose transport system permease protein